MPHVERNGVKVYYETFGQGTPIVFLHPFTTNRYIWSNQIFTFARDHKVIVVDERGHGLSDKPESGYAISEMAADVVAILDDAGVDKAVLVGNSIGGMIAMQTSLDAPDRVLGLLILSSGTNLSAALPPEAGQAFVDNFEAAFDGLLEGATSAKTKRDKPEVCGYAADVYRVGDNFTHAVFLANAGDPNGVFNWNITDRLKDIRQPTLVIAGEEDQATTVEVNQVLADNIPGAQLKVVPDVGHFYQQERPVDFNNDLRSFLKQLDA